jgi:hypothetical protein
VCLFPSRDLQMILLLKSQFSYRHTFQGSHSRVTLSIATRSTLSSQHLELCDHFLKFVLDEAGDRPHKLLFKLLKWLISACGLV